MAIRRQKPNTTMKTKHIRTCVLGLAALGTLLLASCQAPSGPTAAVSCDKCHTIHFKAPVNTGGGVGTAGSKGGAVTRHTCASCGGTLHHCAHH